MSAEIEIATLTFKSVNETIHFYKHGDDDFSYYAENGDCSVRGTLDEIMEDLKNDLKFLF